MLAILSVTFPFFALVGIGYLAARVRLLPMVAVPGLNTYVLYFALPAMLFLLGARTPVTELLDPVVLGVWLLAGLGVVTVAVATARRRGLSWLNASFGALIAVLPNSGFMGIPLLIALIGPQVSGPIGASLLVDIVLLQSLGIALSRRGDRRGDEGDLVPESPAVIAELGAALRKVATNPLLWGILLGAAWGLGGWTLAAPVEGVLTLLAAAATPTALFTIGAVLARENGNRPPGRVRTGIRAWGDVYWLAALKLLVHPLLMWALGRTAQAAGLPLAEGTLAILVLTAALPAAANVSVLAERFGADSGRVARVILVSTVLSFGTFSVIAALLL
ncbi:MAG: AEC family transporter [Propioniciclava sp.]